MPKVIEDATVFRAAMEIFVAAGYEETTMQRIAAAADVHEATLYRKYGDKASLIVLAAEHELADTPMNHLSYSGDLRADLIAAAEAYLATNQRQGAAIPVILSETARHPKLRPMMNRLIANLGGIVRLVHRYQNEGKLKSDDSLYVTGLFIGPMVIYQFTLLSLDEAPVAPFDPATYVETFLHGHAV